MPLAIKVSDALAEEARSAAADADRSLTGQVEHWARLGKAVEPLFSVSTIALLKKHYGGVPNPEQEQLAIKQTLAALVEFQKNPPYEKMREMIFADGPVYEADPNDPAGVVQVLKDGTKISGRLVNRTFVPNSKKV